MLMHEKKCDPYIHIILKMAHSSFSWHFNIFKPDKYNIQGFQSKMLFDFSPSYFYGQLKFSALTNFTTGH